MAAALRMQPTPFLTSPKAVRKGVGCHTASYAYFLQGRLNSKIILKTITDGSSRLTSFLANHPSRRGVCFYYSIVTSEVSSPYWSS
eukprot:9502384-Pyramimonas_sp.AAC.1